MTGIFDSIIDSISDMDASTLLKAGGAAYSAYKGSTAASQYGGEKSPLSELTALSTGTAQLSGGQYPVTKTGATPSVDPEAIEQQWLARLNKFANMQSNTSVKPR